MPATYVAGGWHHDHAYYVYNIIEQLKCQLDPKGFLRVQAPIKVPIVENVHLVHHSVVDLHKHSSSLFCSDYSVCLGDIQKYVNRFFCKNIHMLVASYANFSAQFDFEYLNIQNLISSSCISRTNLLSVLRSLTAIIEVSDQIWK